MVELLRLRNRLGSLAVGGAPAPEAARDIFWRVSRPTTTIIKSLSRKPSSSLRVIRGLQDKERCVPPRFLRSFRLLAAAFGAEPRMIRPEALA